MVEMTEDDLANMSDEEFANLASPPKLIGEPSPIPEEPVETGSDDASVLAQADAAEGGSTEDADGSDDGVDADGGDAQTDPEDGTGEASAEGGPVPGDAADAEGKTGNKAAGDAVVPVDYKAAYDRIMAPFKANGKEIKLQNPDEVVQLMQMGANYTKKLQALQPNLKLLKMLENNGLLDEGKLGYLIDLDKKNPGAIQKLVKDSGIDPMDIDTRTDPGYKPGNHAVSDAEMRFTSTLEDVVSNPAGQSLVVEINKTWDAKSKDALWEDPEVLRVLTEQKQNGTFDAIKAEIDRRRTLGYIGNVPFLQAYQTVGQELSQQGRLGQPQVTGGNNQIPGSQIPNRVVETRVASPKTPAVANSDKARAASTTRTKSNQVQTDFNPLALSDEDFEKYAALNGRL